MEAGLSLQDAGKGKWMASEEMQYHMLTRYEKKWHMHKWDMIYKAGKWTRKEAYFVE